MGAGIGQAVWCLLLAVLLTERLTNAQGCNSNITQQSGTLTSPGYPNNYPDNQLCLTLIIGAENEIIDLRMKSLNLEGSYEDEWRRDSCFDQLRVYDGATINSPLLVYFCGIKTSAELSSLIIRSTSNYLLLVFQSDYRGQRSGYVATFNSHECPEFTYGSETCNTPCTCNKQKTDYCNNTNGLCVCKKGWTSSDCSDDLDECLNPVVEACPIDYTVCVNKIGSFECVCKDGLTKNTNGKCEVGPVYECDDGHGCSHLCAKVSGQDRCYCPDQMKLVGKTCQDCSNVNFGKDCRKTCDCVKANTASCNTETGGCNCAKGWTSSNCSKDIDECTELKKKPCQGVNEICVNTIGGYRCDCKSGFRNSITGVCEECNYILTSPSGIFQSPNYPDNTFENIVCNWTIKASDPTKTIAITFVEYNSGYSDYRKPCLHEFFYGDLKIFDGSNSDSALIGQYCGNALNTSKVYSSGPEMYIQYFSAYSYYRRFKGKYFIDAYQVHRQNLTDQNGIIISPPLSVSPTLNAVFVWVITLANDTVVNLSISENHFSFSDCEKDSLDIYDGSTPGTKVLARLCEGTSITRIVSKQNSMCIVHNSVGNTNDKSFTASYFTDFCSCNPYYTASCDPNRGPCICKTGMTGKFCDVNINECLDNPCPAHSTCEDQTATFRCICFNGTEVSPNGSCYDYYKQLIGPFGTFQSQNFPLQYPEYVNYTWEITGIQGQVVTVRFSDFILEKSQKCYADAMNVYDGEQLSTGLMGKFCGNKIPATLRTTGSVMTLNFQTNQYYYGYTGFKANYYTHDCPPLTYGEVMCNVTCPCASVNTKFCDNIIGECFCKPGYVGRGCSQDRNECRTSGICSANSKCTNTPGSYNCKCNSGFVKNAMDQCIESSNCSDNMKKRCSHLCDLDINTNIEKCVCPEDMYLLNDGYTCAVTLYPHGTDANDSTILEKRPMQIIEDDMPIQITSLVPFGKIFKQSIKIRYNGYIVTNGDEILFPNLDDALKRDVTLLAPFWTEKKTISKGDVYYHVYEKCGVSLYTNEKNENTSPKKSEVIERAIRDIKRFYELTSFEVTTVVVVTWENVEIKGCKYTDTSTFQAILISGYTVTPNVSYLQGEELSFAFYIYSDGKGICLARQPFAVGVVTEDEVKTWSIDKDKPELSKLPGNTGVRGLSKFSVGKIHTESLMCQRYLCKHADLIDNEHFQSEISELYKCPCSLSLLGLQWDKVVEKDNMKCFSISAIAKFRLLRNNQRNRLCCYTWKPPASSSREDWNKSWMEGSFISSGHLLVRDPWPYAQSLGSTNPYAEALENIKARDWCCQKSLSEFCRRFNVIFGDTECTPHPVFVPASALGDPHIQTLDNNNYRMNGVGEYVLILIESLHFTLQGRTSTVLINNEYSKGTSFVAFAAQENSNSNIQVQLDTTTDKMLVLLNKVDYTRAFYSNTNFKWIAESVFVRRENENDRIIFTAVFACGVSFKVFVAYKSLEFHTEMDSLLKNMSKGLLGDFNGIPADDFRLSDGTVLPPNMTERQIHNSFANHYLVDETTSVFTYEDGKSYEDYQDTDFVPIYYDELSKDQISQDVKEFCGGVDSCYFDYMATGSKEFAIKTKESTKYAEHKYRIFKNNPPSLKILDNKDSNEWFINEGKTNVFKIEVNDEDGDAVTTQLLGENLYGVRYSQKGNVLTITYTPNFQSPIQILVKAEDSVESQSPILVIYVVVCPACNNHGECDLNSAAEEFFEGQYKRLACSCYPAYTGKSCELELDACDAKPCVEGQECTDLTAAEQGTNTIGYICQNCPAGTTNIDGVCEDTNECDDPAICEQECENTYRSYKCSCRPGYRFISNTCIDINECNERTSGCAQFCKNTDGSYICECGDGYTLGNDNTSCVIDASRAIMCQHCEQRCYFKFDQIVCDCNLGYEVDASNPTRCSDIDECRSAPCSQTCTNTKGSFFCSCKDGFVLDTDKITCVECNSTHFGKDCSQPCDCRGNGACDKIHGCVCDPGWSGINCDEDIDECLGQHACVDGLVCHNEPGSFICQCQTGYRMESSVCRDIDECLQKTDNCYSENEYCENTEGSYNCKCKEGYTKNKATGVCEDIDECYQHSDNCQHICQNGEGTYGCSCLPGYKLASDHISCLKTKYACEFQCQHGCTYDGDGNPYCLCLRGYINTGEDSAECTDIDECASVETNLCEHKHTCNNTLGNHVCSCDPGFKLQNDGRSCAVCSSGTWGPNCNNVCSCGKGAQSCNPVTGCVCTPGCTGVLCTDSIDKCASGELVCKHPEICVKRDCNSFCECAPGYSYDDGVCQDDNECLNKEDNNCEQICNNIDGSFTCACFNGYRFNSTSNSCTDIDECKESSHNCAHVCTNTFGSFKCSCHTGFFYNEIQNTCNDINECASRALHNCEQICTNNNGSFSCSCHNGYRYDATKKICIVAGPCKCVDSNTKYCDVPNLKCHCKEGWTSDDCSVDVDECKYDPCNENRVCNNLKGSYECLCKNHLQPGPSNTCNDCNRTLTADTGYFMRPFYPDQYPYSTTCTYTIIVDDRATVELSIIEYSVDNCQYDYISIYNGVNDKAELLAQVCPSQQPFFLSSTNKLHVVFKSDYSKSNSGFLARYRSLLPCKTKKCSHTCQASSNTSIEKCLCPEWMTLSPTDDSLCIETNACGSTITRSSGSSGFIVSPNYPNYYPRNTNCRWAIQGSNANNYIKLRFYDFGVFATYRCFSDSLKVFDGNDETSKLLYNLCGTTLPQPIISSGNKIYLVFNTDTFLSSSGFKISYTIYEKKNN